MKADTFFGKHWPLFLLAGILLLTILVYANSINNDFINWDDPENILFNETIRELSWKNFKTWFTTDLRLMYTPLVSLSYCLDFQIGALNPSVYHFTNLLLHLTNIILVFWVFQALTKRPVAALFISALFAVHPVNVDGISWISTRSSLLSTLFFTGALIFYIYYITRDHKLRFLILSAAAFLCAALSKSSAVVLPAILFLIDYFQGRKLTWKLFLEKIPFGIIALVFGLLTLKFRADQGFTDVPLNYNLLDRFIVVCSAFTAYLGKLLFPFRLSYSYSFPEKSGSFLAFYYYLTPVLIAFTVWLFLKLKVPKKTVAFGFLFFFFTAILSQAVLLLDNYQSNRYAYLPYLGLFFVLAGLFEKGLAIKKPAKLKYVWYGLLGAFLVLFSVLTVQRNALWKDSITILDDLLSKEPKTVWAYNSRGVAKMDIQDYEGAIRDFDASAKLNPDYFLVYFNRAIAKQNLGNYSGAVADYDKVITYSPAYSDAFNFRGGIKHMQGDYSGALRDFTRAIQLWPEYANAYYNRALTRLATGDSENACADARRARTLGEALAEQFLAEHCE